MKNQQRTQNTNHIAVFFIGFEVQLRQTSIVSIVGFTSIASASPRFDFFNSDSHQSLLRRLIPISSASAYRYVFSFGIPVLVLLGIFLPFQLRHISVSSASMNFCLFLPIFSVGLFPLVNPSALLFLKLLSPCLKMFEDVY